jgi:penicillin-binding protein 1B
VLEKATMKPARLWLWMTIGVCLVCAVPASLYYLRLARIVGTKLRNGPFSGSATFYASPVVLSVGDRITAVDLVTAVRRAGFKDQPERDSPWFAIQKGRLDLHPDPANPGDSIVFERPSDVITRIHSTRTDVDLPKHEFAPEFLTNLDGDGDRERRRLVHFSDLPRNLVNAIVAIEDKRFFRHTGFDPFRIAKAAYIDLKDNRKEQGASTITMQLARGLYLEPEKAWKRKVNELLITMELERELSKEEILEHYCNQVYLGRYDTFSVHGFGEAARTFFDKDVRDLDLSEAATLAGLIQRPAYLNPLRYPERAEARRNVVLELMRQNGFVSDAEAEKTKQTRLVVRPHVVDAGAAPYFMALANDELQSRLEDHDIEGETYTVETTLDRGLQRFAAEAMEAGLRNVDTQIRRKNPNYRGPMPQVALVALDPHTGFIKALIGGRNYRDSQLNHAIAKRQPGSVFKPFVYAAALRTNAKQFTPASTVLDVPTTFRFANQTYEPGNFGNDYHGMVTLRNALAKSMNIATVKLAEQVGYAKVTQLARESGFNDRIQATPAVALGAYEATPLEVAGAYTVFANGGKYVKPTFLARVKTVNGKKLFEGSPEQHKVLDERVTFLMVSMLEEVMRSGTAADVRNRGFTVPAAGKTGTSRDGWFAGFVADLLCVVWVGFDDNHELDLEGSKSALPIWSEFMKRAVNSRPKLARAFEKPAGIVAVAVDPVSGKLASPDCPESRTEYFLTGTQPTQLCEPDPLFQEQYLFSGN